MVEPPSHRLLIAIYLLCSINLFSITPSFAESGSDPGRCSISAPTPNSIEQASEDDRISSLTIVGFASGMLEPIAKMNALNELCVERGRLTDADTRVIARCPNLRTVVFVGDNLGDSGLSHLAQSKSIRRVLLVSMPRITGAGVLALTRAMPQLQYINAPKTKGNEYVQAVGMLNNMDLVEVPEGTTAAGLRHLKGHQGMRTLRFNGSADDKCILAVGDSPRLERLYIWKGQLTDRGLDYIVAQFPRLEYLKLQQSSIEGHTLNKLLALTQLKELELAEVDFDTEGRKNLELLKTQNRFSIKTSSEVDDDADVTSVETDSGCTWHHQKVLKFYKKNSEFVSPSGAVPSAKIAELKRIILNSKKYSKLDLPSLGITTEKLHVLQPVLRREMNSSDHVGALAWPKGSGAIFERFDIEPDLDDLQNALMEKRFFLLGMGGRDLYVRLNAEPVIRISTSTVDDWLIPWYVQVGNKKWTSYSLEISKCLKDIVKRDDGYFKKFTDDSKYWTERIWENDNTWSTLKLNLLSKNALRIAESMDGYAALSTKFALSGSADTGFDLNKPSIGINFLLSPKSGQWALDYLNCRVPFDRGIPQGDWAARVAEFFARDKAVQRIPAILNWKTASAQNKVIAWDLDAKPEFRHVLKYRWRAKNLQGEPEWIFVLESAGKPVAVVAASEQSDKVLVGPANPEQFARGATGLTTGVSFHCRDDEILVSEKNGTLAIDPSY